VHLTPRASLTSNEATEHKHKHKYVAVLGSCCTADAIEATSFEAVATAKLRLVLFQGRTTFLSMASEGFSPEEFEYTSEWQEAPKLEWGARMVACEITKSHRYHLAEVISLTDALIIDHVSAFTFPTLYTQIGERYFLKSWELEKYILPRIKLRQAPLWHIPISLSLNGLRQVLGSLYECQPNLSVIFHIPDPCFNDGVGFSDPVITANINFYRQYCDRLYTVAAQHFPRVSAISLSSGRADPMHRNGPHPFRYEKAYLNLVRQEMERILDV
jgi:hypothetical protein